MVTSLLELVPITKNTSDLREILSVQIRRTTNTMAVASLNLTTLPIFDLTEKDTLQMEQVFEIF